MDKLFRWAVIVILSLLTLNVVIAEYVEVTPLQTPVEVILVKKKEVVEKPIVKKEIPITKIIKEDVKKIKKESDTPNINWKERIQYRCDFHSIEQWTCSVALRIANAESWYNPCAKFWTEWNCSVDERKLFLAWYDANWKPIYSSAAWIFQFVNRTRDGSSKAYWFEWASKYNWDANIQVALLKMKNEWFSARNASSHNR